MADRQSRRWFLRRMSAIAAVGGLPVRSRPASPELNVLFISVSDLNDWIGCLGGHPDAHTPNMDRLAGRGVLFTNAHCPAPNSNASRAAVLTGVRPSTSGVYSNTQPMRRSEALREALTLPEHFTANGYRTMGGGAVFHDAFPDPQSWKEYYPFHTRTPLHDPLPANRPANGIPDAADFDWGPVDARDSAMADSRMLNWATGELVRPQPGPFFIACGILRPRLPWFVPAKYFERFPADRLMLPAVRGGDLDDIPQIGRKFAGPDGNHRKVIESGQWRKALQGYLASISFADACVGRIIDALDAGPHSDNTVVVLWSDHGVHLGQKSHWGDSTLWEESTRTVLMIVSPAIPRGGGRCNRPVSLIDIYPTLSELCGLPPGKKQEGTSLLPLLKDPAASWDWSSLTTCLRGNHSVRGQRWRYTRYRDGSEELYDHDADKFEWTNLAGKRDLASVKNELARWLPRSDAPGEDS